MLTTNSKKEIERMRAIVYVSLNELFSIRDLQKER